MSIAPTLRTAPGQESLSTAHGNVAHLPRKSTNYVVDNEENLVNLNDRGLTAAFRSRRGLSRNARRRGAGGPGGPEKAADGFDELGHRDWLRQIGLATAFADALLVALHRKRGHRDHRNGLELGVFLEPLGHFETGDFRQLNVHQDQVGTVLAGKIERLDAVARADGVVAVSLQQLVEELHVELIVLHDHHGLRHCRPSEIDTRAVPGGPSPLPRHRWVPRLATHASTLVGTSVVDLKFLRGCSK